MVTTFGLEYFVNQDQPEKEERFISAMRDAIAALREMPGHTETRFFRDVDQPHAYLVFSEWDNDDAFKAFMKSDIFAAAIALGREILAGKPRHRTFVRRQPSANA